jgi:hypothetical protein
MSDLTPDSVAVRLYLALMNDDQLYVLNHLSRSSGARMTAQRLASEHERLCASRIAAAEKAARVGALREALECHPTTAENPNENSYQRGRFDGVIEYGRAIGALITAAEAHPVKDSTHG